MGHITEVITFARPVKSPPCKKINKDEYLDLRTGEVCEYKHIENRSESLGSIRNTMALIRALVNTNITDPDTCRWITLTYAENMTDPKQLYADYFKFWKRFCYWCKSQGIVKPNYITVQEPQGRGAWHVHAFFIWPGKAPFIQNQKLAELWGHGFTKTKALQDCDNIGAYFSAYLADMPLDDLENLSDKEKEKALSNDPTIEEKIFVDDQGLEKDKRFVKGGRLYLYPPGMNIVRYTKGIKKPEIEKMTFQEAKEKVCSAKQTFSRTYEIIDESGQTVNTLTKSYYNSKRK